MPPIALGFAKELCDGLDGPAIRRGIQTEIAAQVALFGTEDFTEGMAAMREKRAPRFTGR
jgi:enoyl-CoA hydratase/carnithine racemase